MSIDINQVNSLRPEGPKRNDAGKAATSSAQNTDKGAITQTQETNSRDSVSLSSTAKNLAQIENELKSQPDINQSKVDEIKARIENNNYQINSQNLAQKLLDTEV